MPAKLLNNRLLAILPDLKRFALSLTRNREQAEDLVQDTSLRVMRKGIPDDVDLRRWAFRVCKNAWIDQLRKQKNRLETTGEEDENAGGVHDGEATVEGRSELDTVMTIMARLPQDQQIALSLVAIEGMSYREVSDVMDVPIGTIMSRVSRARGSIADALAAGQEGANDQN